MCAEDEAIKSPQLTDKQIDEKAFFFLLLPRSDVRYISRERGLCEMLLLLAEISPPVSSTRGCGII